MKTGEQIEFWIRRMLRNMFVRPGMYDKSPEAFDAMLSTGLWFWSVVTDRERRFTILDSECKSDRGSIETVLARHRLIAHELGLFDLDTDETCPTDADPG